MAFRDDLASMPALTRVTDHCDDDDIEISVTDESEEEEEEEEEEDIEEDDEEEEEELEIEENMDQSTFRQYHEMRQSPPHLEPHNTKCDSFDKTTKHGVTTEHDSETEDCKSAFSKPNGFHNFHAFPQGYPHKIGPKFPNEFGFNMSSYLDQRAAMTQYWLHLSKLYGSHMAMQSVPPFVTSHMHMPPNPSSPFQVTPEMLQKRAHLLQTGFHPEHPKSPLLPASPTFFPPTFPFPYPGMMAPHGLPGTATMLREPGEIGIRSPAMDAISKEQASYAMAASMRTKRQDTSSRLSSESASPASRRRSTTNSSSAPTSPVQSPSFANSLSASSGAFPAHFPFPTSVTPLTPSAAPPGIPTGSVPGMTTPLTSPPISENGLNAATAAAAGMAGLFFPPMAVTSGYGTRRPRDPNKPPPVKKYKCDICGKAFSRSNTLVTHRRIHTGEKPFQCEICSRAFRQPGNLTRHRLTHTSVKPYVCVVCKKAFNRASNLHTHMRTHANFRPFLCPYCGKGFQQKVDLKIHMYTHANRH